VWLALATPASAGPAMYDASFIIHAWGNDVTAEPYSPSNTSVFVPMPLGTTGCSYSSSSSSYGSSCPPLSQRGQPATGMGFIGVATTGTGPAPIALPEAAFGVTTMGFWPIQIPASYYMTYARFENDAGFFFAGGGPTTYTFSSTTSYSSSSSGSRMATGRWSIQPGPNRFGGALGLLGEVGARWVFEFDGTPFAGTSSWNMVKPLGRGPGDPDRTYTNTGMFVNAAGTQTHTFTAIGRGTRWTTGSVTVSAMYGSFTTILHRAGYDTTTPGGVRNLQLVTPAIVQWIGWGGATNNYAGHIGILTLQVPEPSDYLFLGAGLGLLAVLHRMRGR